MKRSLLFILLSIFIAAPAYAVSYELDLSSYGLTVLPPGGTGVVSIDSNMTINSLPGKYATINQSYVDNIGVGSDPTKLDNGDTFTEFGFLGVAGSDGTPFVLIDGGTPSTFYNLYFEFKDLAGYITDYSGPDIAIGSVPGQTSSFDIIFTPGAGSVALYLDTDTDFTNAGTVELAEFELTSGRGLSPAFVLNGASGPFDINLSFEDVAAGVWSIGGTDLIAGPGGNLDLFSMFTRELGASTEVLPAATADGFTTQVSNAGFIYASVVPEPGTILLLGFGLLGLSGLSRRKFMKK